MTTPSTPHDTAPGPAPDPLERRLAALTDWRDAEPTLHAEALRRERKAADDGAAPSRFGLLGRMRLRPAVGIPVVVAATLVFMVAAQFWTGTGSGVAPVDQGISSFAPAAAEVQDAERSRYARVPASPAPVDKAPAAQAPASPAADSDRSVIRKATIDIESKDVRADFSRVALLVNEAMGEFIEASSLTGEGAAAQGTLTLRVAADRLSDVLNELRTLGTVASEKASGDDVTEQVVDLSARLRNEQKVEDELLKLLETREGAPLKEILDLREQLARVREHIEQMTAQQERINKSVALATILVILRPAVPPDAEAEHSKHESALDYFGRQLDGAWHAGTRALADSAAAFVRAAVGGLVWWVLIGCSITAIVRAMREARRRRASRCRRCSAAKRGEWGGVGVSPRPPAPATARAP